MSRNSLKTLQVFVPVAATLLFVSSASAATIDWSATAGTTLWNTGTNWVGGVAPANDTTTDVAQFNQASYARLPDVNTARSVGGVAVTAGSANVTINVGSNFVGYNLTVGSSGVSIASGKGLTFGYTYGGNLTVTGAVVNDGLLTVSSGDYNDVHAISGNISGTGALTKSSSSLLVLSGTNTYTGVTTATGLYSILRLDSANALPGGIGSSGGLSNLTLSAHGVVELTTNSGDFTRPLGTGVTDVQITSGGGFSAYGGNRTVNLGGASTQVTWGSATFVSSGGLVLSSAKSDSTVDFQNPMSLNSDLRTIFVPNGSADVDAVLSGVISGTGVSGLLKSDQAGITPTGSNGTLRLDAANTYAGGTHVQSGVLLANAVGAVPHYVYVGGANGDLNGVSSYGTLASNVSGGVAGPVYVRNGGTVKSSSNLPYTQTQIFPGGAIQYDASGDLPGGTGILGQTPNFFNNSVVSAGYSEAGQSFVDKVANGFVGTLAMSANSTQNVDLTGKSGIRLAAWQPNAQQYGYTTPASILNVVYSGTITPAGSTYRFGGGNARLTVPTALSGANDLDLSSPNVIVAATPGGSTRAWLLPNRLDLTAANTLTGSVGVGAYNVLTLTGANGSLNAASGISLKGGQLKTTDASGASNNNRLPDASPLNVDVGGTLWFTGTGGQTETVGALNLNAGQLDLLDSARVGTGAATLQFASLNRSTGAMLAYVSSSGTTNVNFASAPPVLSGNVLGGWAVYGQSTSWLTYNGTSLGTLATYQTGPETGWVSTDNVSISAGTTLTANRTIQTLRSTATATLDIGSGQVLTLGAGGLMNGAQGVTLTLNNGTLTAGNSNSNYELFLHTGYIRTLAINSVIADNGVNPVSLAWGHDGRYSNGTGEVQLAGSNTYSGGTYLDGYRYVSVRNDSALGTGPVYVNGKIPTDYNNITGTSAEIAGIQLYTAVAGNRTIANNFFVNSDFNISTLGTGPVGVLTGNMVLANDASVVVSSSNVYLRGPISGTGSLRTTFSNGATYLDGTSANTYTGGTYAAAPWGTLYLNKTAGVNAIPGDLYIGSSGLRNTVSADYKTVQLSASNQIADTGVVYFFGDATTNTAYLTLNGNSDTIGGLSSLTGAGIVQNNHATTASTLTLNVTAGNSYSFGGLVRNGAAAALNLIKDGTGVQTLTGLNTYTGTTTINAGKLVAGNNSALGTGAVTVNSGGTLVLAPGIGLSNSITVNNGGYFGPQTTVASGGGYAGVTNTISTSVTGQLGTTLDLLAGTAGADRTLDILWRARAASEGDVSTPGTHPPLPGNIHNLISDVVSFTGTGSDLYVLQLSYNEGQIYNIGYGENNLVTDGFLYLSYLNAGTYENGILGNTGNNATSAQQKYLGTFASFQTTYGSTLSNYIGAYGVDTTGNVAWAVVNHNSEWAVVPEPGTLALLAFGSMAVLNIRRRKNAK